MLSAGLYIRIFFAGKKLSQEQMQEFGVREVGPFATTIDSKSNGATGAKGVRQDKEMSKKMLRAFTDANL
jgi:hypothetical protein